MGLHKGRLKHFNIWLFNPNCIHIFHLISSITLLGILFFFFQEFQVYALGSNKTYNEVNLREFYLWKYSWKRKEKKKAYKDLARFWRVCDEFSWVYKPTWISSLPYTRVCVCVGDCNSRYETMLCGSWHLWRTLVPIPKKSTGIVLVWVPYEWNVDAGLDLVLCRI